ncbi:MAG: DUF3828 domain-containing protein [Proteobacteria bacterium]|nr:DUF3828 domain-containing protein [Pseudomonadota bacterium]
MRAILVVVLGAWLTACSPAQQQAPTQSPQSPEAVVRAVYDAATQRNAHNQTTNVDDLPLSEALKTLVRQASDVAQANDEPFIDGDPVLDCQDCSPLSAVAVTTTSQPANGRATVVARFTVAGDARVETWDMVATPQGWRADNIRGGDGYNLRQSAEEEIRQASKSCAETRGAQDAAQLVAQCVQVSPATHPPCNAANSCGVIEAEIRRSCGLLDAARRPAFCTEATDEAP